MLKNFKSLIIISILAVLTSCSPHWDSYSTSTRAKKGRVENANGKSGRRKKVGKGSSYSGGGKYYHRKNGSFYDSYSVKTKKRHRKHFEHNGKNHKKRGKLFKPKRRIRKRKGQSR